MGAIGMSARVRRQHVAEGGGMLGRRSLRQRRRPYGGLRQRGGCPRRCRRDGLGYIAGGGHLHEWSGNAIPKARFSRRSSSARARLS